MVEKRRGIYLWLLFTSTLFYIDAVYADDSELLSIDELRVPVSPAFTVLDIAPTSVERPSSARALAASIVSSTERSEGNFPSNLALEFTPYWWEDHPDLTFDGYYNADFGQLVLQSLAISLGTSDLAKYSKDAMRVGTALGVGFKTILAGGKASPELADKVTQLKRVQQELLKPDCIPDITGSGSKTVTTSESEIQLNAACQQLQNKMKNIAKEITKEDKERVGWVVEAAAAMVSEFPDDKTDDSEVSRYSLWLTASYRGTNTVNKGEAEKAQGSGVTFVGVGRYTKDDRANLDDDLYDIGARVIWKSRSNKWAASAEALHRAADQRDDSQSYKAVIEYVLNESYSLIASYGKDFKDIDGKSDLIAFAGVNFGWGKGPVVKF